MIRSHSCGRINKETKGQKVTLAGWVERRRDHGGLIFIDLRDREGLVQVVFNPEKSKECHDIASRLRNEYVIRTGGEVALRPPGTENTKLASGDIEIIADSIEILNESKTPPFYINEDAEVDENLRLKYRYLDLRRPHMKENLILRHRVVKFMRDFLDFRGFIDIETPILIKSTPEGARDYLVPSRVSPGKFYALPQSPQQLKQLLMVAGVEKYYQIARCFRDEDTRADRQPEFTQLDIEMSFIDEEDIINLLEELFTSLVENIKPEIKLIKPFIRLNYAEAMERYGTDKPDLRFKMKIGDISDIAGQTEFAIFKNIINEGGRVKGICAPGCADYSRHQLNEINEMAKSAGAQGLVTISLDSSATSLDEITFEDIKSVVARHLTIDQIRAMAIKLGASAGDLLLVVAGDNSLVSTVLGKLRLEMGYSLKLADPNTFSFAFIENFPLMKWNKEAGFYQPMHHPFTSPRDEDIQLLDNAPEKAYGRHYDMVLNGYEIAGGSIRIHKSELQRKIFRLMGYTDSDVE
ncbi:MAG: aspartate--tRNA ligase, partial [Dehalococcoidales bacterium]|nr:aspartate--tRNA ligase [Dehalococcoidales bacterium]